jgi:hypothetical protein
MKIYLAIAGYHYEGSWVLGAYSTESAAQKRCDDYRKEDEGASGYRSRYAFEEVEEYELDE